MSDLQNTSKKLFVFYEGQKVGDLIFSETDITLNYDDLWKKTGFALSPHLPLHAPHTAINVRRYFENLFPEGQGFNEILEQWRINRSNTYGLLKLIGHDSTGAFIFTEHDHLSKKSTSFREVTFKELAERLDERSSSGLIVWDEKVRLSVAGIQDKLVITQLDSGKIGFGEGDLASTHILKFQKQNPNIQNLVLNEHFCMTLAKAIGIDVPDVYYIKIGDHPALMVTRFDRKKISDKYIKRIHVIDACQALNLPPHYKYEQNFGSSRDVAHIRDGVNYAKLFDLARSNLVPAKEILKLLHWIFFNLCISNYDNHGKNISYFLNKEGLQSAPFYDLVNISMYPKIDQKLALAFGGEFDPHAISVQNILDFCEIVGVKKQLIKKEFILLGKNISSKLDTVMDEKNLSLSENEIDFLSQLKRVILAKTTRLVSIANRI